MKYFLILVITLLFSMPVQAQPVPESDISKCMSGSWYNPDKDGEGIELTVMDGSLYGYVYTYRGTAPEWYVFAGDITAKDKVNLYKTIKTNDPWEATVHEVGSMGYEVIDNDHITFSMFLQMDLWRDVIFPMCLSNCTTIFEYERLTQPVPCLGYSE